MPLALRLLAGIVLLFLIAPVIVIVPLSFNAEPYFTFTPEMLSLAREGFSLRWYAEIFASAEWMQAIRTSLGVGFAATSIATVLGTLAALGLARPEMPARAAVTAFLISPLVVPVVIAASGMFFFYSDLRLTGTTAGLVIAHAALGAPFVVITVLAALAGHDPTLGRAAASLGADPATVFFRVTLPLILPGVVTGALFAFVTSFDEVVAVLFLGGPEQRTIPRQMWSGVRENMSPAILAVATLLIAVSALLLIAIEVLRARADRLRTRTSNLN